MVHPSKQFKITFERWRQWYQITPLLLQYLSKFYCGFFKLTEVITWWIRAQTAYNVPWKLIMCLAEATFEFLADYVKERYCHRSLPVLCNWLFRVNNEKIKNVENLRLLGVTIDSKFTFTITICKKASQRIGVLMWLRNLIPTKAKLMLFKSAVFCRCSEGRKLERLQDKGLRAVYRDKHASYQKLFERAELPTLLNGRLQDICILMYKVKYSLCPTYICNLFNSHKFSYSLRHSDFSIPRYNTAT